MAKKNEVVRCVRQQAIATYDVNDGFLVDVVLDVKELMYSYWLYHKEYGVKVRYVQVPKIYKNDDGYTITNIAKPEDVENYFNPEAWKENKKHYTDNYILQISGSKAFSYAGQRIGVTAISDKLYHRAYPGLTQRYGGGTFGTVYIHRVLYALSSGTSHSAQFALAAMFKAAADGTFDFISEVKEYGRRAERLKKIFTDYGFRIVYDHDLDEPIADGFYFTIAYPGMTGGELMEELIYYGVSAISLSTTGSNQEGLRACTSFIKPHQYALLEERLKLFKENHTA